MILRHNKIPRLGAMLAGGTLDLRVGCYATRRLGHKSERRVNKERDKGKYKRKTPCRIYGVGLFFCVLYSIFGGITNIIGGGMKGWDGLVFYFRGMIFSNP